MQKSVTKEHVQERMIINFRITNKQRWSYSKNEPLRRRFSRRIQGCAEGEGQLVNIITKPSVTSHFSTPPPLISRFSWLQLTPSSQVTLLYRPYSSLNIRNRENQLKQTKTFFFDQHQCIKLWSDQHCISSLPGNIRWLIQ